MIGRILQNEMYKKHREKILLALDLLIVVFSYVFSFWIKEDFSFNRMQNISFQELIISLMIILIIYAFFFILFRVHKSLWKYINTSEVLNLTKANVWTTLTILVITLILRKSRFYLSLEIIAGGLSLLLMFSMRTVYRMYRHYTSKSSKGDLVNTVIIGAGDGGNLLMKEILQNSNLKYNVVGFIDDYKKNVFIAGKPVMGKLADLPEIVINNSVKMVLIARPSASREEIIEIAELCAKCKIDVKMMNTQNILDDTTGRSSGKPVKDIKIEDLLGRGEVRLEQQEIESYICDRVICVTGAGGSIGSELCRQLVKFKPKQLVMVDINENALYMLEQEFNRKRRKGAVSSDIKIISIIASVRDGDQIDEIFKMFNVEVVYHAAAHKHVPLMETRPGEAIKNNVFGTKNVIDACINNKVSRFILISTDKAVNPTNVMGATKRMTELILQAYGKNSVTKMAAVRFGNVLGSNGSVIPIFKEQIKNGGPVTITHKEITRYFMTIPEAAQLVLQAGFYADCGEIFVLDMGEPVKIIDLAENTIRLSGFKPYTEIEIKEIGLREGEKMFEELRLDDESTSRTKNDLIFLNESKNIDANKVNLILDELEQLISTVHEREIVKKKLLEFIKKDLEEY